ncbi:hypothetical protein [Microcoleus sp. OTE_8_concoct_300]|uniref:hypothetical protein n=1 Tax=Microcoleus sp. OTE_8_concoct_300 TaxID=2964710 RepID=UPI00403F6F6A
MSNKVRDRLGKFVFKSEAPRKIRSVNLTDDAWHWLATVAEKAGVSRNDYLEALASSNEPFMEMVESPSPPFIETVRTGIEADGANIPQQPDSELLPFIETVRAENQRLHIELGNSASEKELLKQELVKLRSQLETECADREDIEAELSELKQNSAPAATLSGKPTPDAATILSQLRARRKKSKTDLSDLEAILEILKS